MDWFAGLRSPGLHYGNDSIASWNFTVTPDEMCRVIKALAKPGVIPEGGELQSPVLSLMLAIRQSRLGDMGFEGVCGRDGADVLSKAILDAFAPSNQLAKSVMEQQRQIILT
jgi:hypothetical protein